MLLGGGCNIGSSFMRSDMTYLSRITSLKDALERMESPARIDLPFQAGREPTQAFSEFLTNKEQGDWAERTFIANFNRQHSELWAVKYGRSEDIVAGDVGFHDYFLAYQRELATIGKRPDLLLFDREPFVKRFGNNRSDISTLPDAELAEVVREARAAVEVRSSAFISGKYEAVAGKTRRKYETRVLTCARELVDAYRQELAQFSPTWLDFATRLCSNGTFTEAAPRAMSRRSTARLRDATELTRQIKADLKAMTQRDFLSITPKAEDLSLVYRWIQCFEVPHYYCQVFFDKAVMISFERILHIIGTPHLENVDFYIESDEKNQRKTTFKINVRLGREVMTDIRIPTHSSAMKELPRGRLLFYVKFDASDAVFDTGSLHDV